MKTHRTAAPIVTVVFRALYNFVFTSHYVIAIVLLHGMSVHAAGCI